MPLHPAAVALSLLLLSAVPAHARPTPAPHTSRHHGAEISELLSADDLNAMVLSILGGQPQPALSGSEARQQRVQAAWENLHSLLNGQS
jgi:hypothetical protein